MNKKVNLKPLVESPFAPMLVFHSLVYVGVSPSDADVPRALLHLLLTPIYAFNPPSDILRDVYHHEMQHWCNVVKEHASLRSSKIFNRIHDAATTTLFSSDCPSVMVPVLLQIVATFTSHITVTSALLSGVLRLSHKFFKVWPCTLSAMWHGISHNTAEAVTLTANFILRETALADHEVIFALLLPHHSNGAGTDVSLPSEACGLPKPDSMGANALLTALFSAALRDLRALRVEHYLHSPPTRPASVEPSPTAKRDNLSATVSSASLERSGKRDSVSTISAIQAAASDVNEASASADLPTFHQSIATFVKPTLQQLTSCLSALGFTAVPVLGPSVDMSILSELVAPSPVASMGASGEALTPQLRPSQHPPDLNTRSVEQRSSFRSSGKRDRHRSVADDDSSSSDNTVRYHDDVASDDGLPNFDPPAIDRNASVLSALRREVSVILMHSALVVVAHNLVSVSRESGDVFQRVVWGGMVSASQLFLQSSETTPTATAGRSRLRLLLGRCVALIESGVEPQLDLSTREESPYVCSHEDHHHEPLCASASKPPPQHSHNFHIEIYSIVDAGLSLLPTTFCQSWIHEANRWTEVLQRTPGATAGDDDLSVFYTASYVGMLSCVIMKELFDVLALQLHEDYALVADAGAAPPHDTSQFQRLLIGVQVSLKPSQAMLLKVFWAYTGAQTRSPSKAADVQPQTTGLVCTLAVSVAASALASLLSANTIGLRNVKDGACAAFYPHNRWALSALSENELHALFWAIFGLICTERHFLAGLQLAAAFYESGAYFYFGTEGIRRAPQALLLPTALHDELALCGPERGLLLVVLCRAMTANDTLRSAISRLSLVSTFLHAYMEVHPDAAPSLCCATALVVRTRPTHVAASDLLLGSKSWGPVESRQREGLPTSSLGDYVFSVQEGATPFQELVRRFLHDCGAVDADHGLSLPSPTGPTSSGHQEASWKWEATSSIAVVINNLILFSLRHRGVRESGGSRVIQGFANELIRQGGRTQEIAIRDFFGDLVAAVEQNSSISEDDGKLGMELLQRMGEVAHRCKSTWSRDQNCDDPQRSPNKSNFVRLIEYMLASHEQPAHCLLRTVQSASSVALRTSAATGEASSPLATSDSAPTLVPLHRKTRSWAVLPKKDDAVSHRVIGTELVGEPFVLTELSRQGGEDPNTRRRHGSLPPSSTQDTPHRSSTTAVDGLTVPEKQDKAAGKHLRNPSTSSDDAQAPVDSFEYLYVIDEFGKRRTVLYQHMLPPKLDTTPTFDACDEPAPCGRISGLTLGSPRDDEEETQSRTGLLMTEPRRRAIRRILQQGVRNAALNPKDVQPRNFICLLRKVACCVRNAFK